MANTTNRTTRIKHVYGNVLKLAIPLTLRTVTLEGGIVEVTDTNYTPSNHYPVVVQFVNGPLKYELDATIRDNYIAVVEDKGTIPVGNYAIVVLCKDDNGDPRRFKQRCVLEVVDVTADAGIEVGIEFEAQEWLLDGAIFLAIKGEDGIDGVGIESITTDETSVSGEYNQVTFHLTNGSSYTLNVRNGESTEQTLPANVVVDENYVHTDNNYTDTDKQKIESVDKLFADAEYDRISRRLNFFKHGDTMHTNPLKSIDITDFIMDSRVSSFRIVDGNLTIRLNSDGNNEEFKVPISSIFNPNNYYTKEQTDAKLSQKVNLDATTGRVDASQATRVVLDYIVGIYDGEDEPSHDVNAGDVWYDNGQIYYAYNNDVIVVIISLGAPQKDIIYCNAENNKLYRWNGSEFVQVGGSGSGSEGYEPPIGGIPKTDLAPAVQASLDLADSALQSQTQVDWNQTTTTAVDYIKNKPTIPTKVSDLTNDSGFTSNAGTVTGISVNGGTAQQPTNGVVNLTIATGGDNDIVGISDGTASDGAVEFSKRNGDTVTLDFNHSHPQYALANSLSTVATSGDYDDLTGKPTKVSDFTNDSGFTSNAGTITGITMNGTSKGTSGVVNLGTVITAHQDISGKANKSEMAVSTSGDQTTITLKTGTSVTVINQHQSLSGYAKYVLLADEAAYMALATKDSGTLYLIPES